MIPAYGQPRQVLPGVRLVLAHNPSPMTLEGTNTWLLGTDRVVVVDPGPADEAHLQAVLDACRGAVAEVVLTHGHPDHSAGARRFRELSGAPLRALDPRFCEGGQCLGEGTVLATDEQDWTVSLSPGHTRDSVCLQADTAVLTGDTVLGRGSTVVAWPDGDLAEYLSSLRRLAQLGDRTVLPGHGPVLASAAAVATQYLEHRAARLAQVRSALGTAGGDVHRQVEDVVAQVYADVDPALWPAARLSVRAQLEYLQRVG